MNPDLQKQYEEAHDKAKEIIAAMPDGKKKTMAELSMQQVELTIQAANDAIAYAKSLKKYPRFIKRKKSSFIPVLNSALQIRMLEIQKRIVASQPVPKFKEGGTKFAKFDGSFPEVIIKGK